MTVPADDAGMLTFKVDIANRPTLSPSFVLAVDINADSNPLTGETANGAGGIDYLLLLKDGQSMLGRWNGSGFERIPATTALAGPTSVAVRAGDLGVTGSFQFWVGVFDDANDPQNWDPAPEAGAFTYSLQAAATAPATAAAPTIKSVVYPGTLLLPRAGKILSARGVRLGLDDGEVVSPDSMTCVLKLAGKTIAPVAGGCKWRIPLSAKGKTGTLRITATYKGQTTNQALPIKVGK